MNSCLSGGGWGWEGKRPRHVPLRLINNMAVGGDRSSFIFLENVYRNAYITSGFLYHIDLDFDLGLNFSH